MCEWENKIDEYIAKRKNAKCTSCKFWFTCDKQDQSKLECEWYKPLTQENYNKEKEF